MSRPYIQTATYLALTVACAAPTVCAMTHAKPSVDQPQQNLDAQRLRHFKGLVEAAEKACKDGNEEEAAERVGEAEAYTADWPLELLRGDEADALLVRLAFVSKEMNLGVDDPDVSDLGDGELLTGEQLRTELELVETAEAGTEFDFPIDLNEKVLAFVGSFTGRNKGYMQDSLSRGSRYMPMILSILAEEGVPLDLAYLPIVESGFKNTARSRAAAVGMWQFIRPTGKAYGLRQDAWVDERRDPEKSTRAAARFLKYLYSITDDWYLSLAGYNAGPGRVFQAIAGTGSRNFWDHARSRYLRNETKGYVPQFCAAVLVGKHPDRFGLFVSSQELYEYETVTLNKSISLNSLSRGAGLGQDTLRELNPELVRGMTPPRSYDLKVPVGSTADVAGAIGAIPASERVELRTYKIKQGDTLAKVSARYNISQDELLSINNIRKAQFRVGRNIQVPVVIKIGPPAKKPQPGAAKKPAAKPPAKPQQKAPTKK